MTIQDIYGRVRQLIQSAPPIVYPDESTFPDLTLVNQGLQTLADLIPGLGAALQRPSLRFSGFSDDDQSPLLALSGLLQTGDSEVWVTLEIHTRALAVVSLSLGAVPPGEPEPEPFALADLFQLAGGVNFFQELPGELDLADQLAISSLGIAYDFSSAKLLHIQLAVALGDWEIFSGFTLARAALALEINEPFLPTRTIAATIGGGYEIRNSQGSLVTALDAELFIPAGGGDWELAATGALGDDTEGFLDAISTNIQIAGWLPDTLTNASLAIREFFLRFSPAGKRIIQTRIDVGIALEWEIIPNLLSLADPFLAFNIVWPDKTQNPAAKAQIEAQLGGQIGIAGAALAVTARRDESGTWEFSGQLEGEIPLIDTARQFLGNGVAPPSEFNTNLSLNILEAQITVPPTTQQPNNQKTFQISCGISDLWSFKLGDFNIAAEELRFTIDHRGPGQTAGKLEGLANFNGMRVAIAYAFAPGAKKISLDWEGILGEYETTATAEQILRLRIHDKSVGDIISLFVRTANPGLGTYRLPEPWDFLDKIPADFEIEYTVKGPRKGQLKAIKPLNINILEIIEVESVEITRTPAGQVNVGLRIDGLGEQSWNAADPASAPPDAGGLGQRLIDLRLLAMGQRVSLQNPAQVANMKQAIAQMRRFTLPGAAGIPDAIRFNPNSNWLIGMDFGLLRVPPFDDTKPPVFALQLSALFNDPDIYGLRIELNGDKIPPLKGLQFEILYTKINDSIGKYHVELVLPDIMRYIEMGAVSLVLPVIVVDVYTNGDFLVDFGFPYDFDFRRSFSVTVIVLGVPVLGSGGFYFGKLSGPTAPPRVPRSSKGEFNPVMVFGLGLQIGVGKHFQKGPLTARFSLTIVGMIEGIVATFNPHNALPEGGRDIEKSNYLYLRGALGIIGILEGAVDFKVIRARVLIRLQVIAQAVFESYRAMPLSLAASVQVEASVKIDLGLFSVTLEFSFKATISATFTVGRDRLEEAPWYDGAQARSFLAARSLGPMLALNPLPAPAQKETLTLYGTLQPTVAWAAPDTPASQLVFGLVMECPSSQGNSGGDTPFEKMADSVFQWVAQTAYASGKASRDALEQLLGELRGDALGILPFASLIQHLNSQFDIRIEYPDHTIDPATPFPVFPAMRMQVKRGQQTLADVDFGAFGKCNGAYLNFLSRYFEAMTSRPDDPAFEESPGFAENGQLFSLTEQLFEDYFLTIAREMVGAALSWMEENQLNEAPLAGTLAALQAGNTAGRLSSMLARFYLGGQRLPKNAGLVLQSEPATFDGRFGIFQVTGQQFPLPGNEATTLSLSAGPGLSLPAAPWPLPANLLAKLAALQAEAATPPVWQNVSLTAPFRLEARTWPLSRAIEWESESAWIWEFPESLLRQLGRNAGALSGLKIGVIPEKTFTTEWAALVEFTVKKTANPLAAEIVGAGETGIALLEKIILDNGSWEDLHLLYRPVGDGQSRKKLVSREKQDFTAFIAQVNLSTETNPVAERGMLRARGLTAPTGVLDQKDFIGRLWAASIVRSGGHYLYYQDSGGAGLPAELFGQDNTATLYLLLRFRAGAPGSYANCAITGQEIDRERDTVFASDPAFTDQYPETQPGVLLLQATRPMPAAGSFAELFQLLSYEIEPGGHFAHTVQVGAETEIASATPAGPQKNGEAGVWHFEHLVPAHRFAPGSGPYAGLGHNIGIRMQTRDIYGNAIPQTPPPAEHTLGYTDPLIPLHQWPVKWELAFSASELSATAALASEPGSYEKDLRLLKKVQDQLAAPGLRADLRSTFLGDDPAAEPGAANAQYLQALRDFVRDAIIFLDRGINDPANPPGRPNAVLRRAFNPTQINQAAIFELLTEVQLRRTAHIDPGYAGAEAVRLARTPIRPLSAENFELALRHFAESFEAQFPGLKLATGFDKEELDNYEQQKDLFVLRMDRFTWQHGEPVALALPPLSAQLLNRTVNVRTYSKGSGFDESAALPLSFTDVDMDDWARLFLDAFDTLLSPELAGGVYLADKEALEALLSARKELAAAIAGKLMPVLGGQQAPGLPAAREKLRQRLLSDLKQAYEVNAVVQFPLSFANPAGGEEVRVYGAPTALDTGRPYNFSTAKIRAAASATLEFLFSTRTVREEPFVAPHLEFRATHLEYRVQDNPRFEGYQASSWLRFVIPPPARDLGVVQIPVVLRDYPEAPLLLRQDYRPSTPPEPGLPAAEALRLASSWDYLLRYNQRLSAQDLLQVEVQFNLPESAQRRALSATEDLFDALAIFAHHWPALRADLLAELPGITPQTVAAADLTAARNAIGAFSAMAAAVASRWASWTPPRTVLMGAHTPSARIFTVREVAANGKLSAQFQDLNPATDPAIPMPKLLVGASDRDHGLFGYGEGSGEPLRALVFEQLDLLAYQNALSAVYLSRNEELIPGKATAADFVYLTPQTRFPFPVIPLLQNDYEIDMRQLLPGQHPTAAYIAAFFNELFDEAHLPDGEDHITLQLECSYAYKLASGPEQPFIRLPILLVPPYDYRPAGDELPNLLAREIAEWVEAARPAPGNAEARLLFDVAVFSTTGSDRQPVLRLRNVFLIFAP